MKHRIIDTLNDIQKSETIRIIYACESGSRAWGFSSRDSDFDVRFIYVRPRDWYLSIDDRRDVIERPIIDELDLNGWDLRKSLRLLRKSNPPLLEWLQSPIVYQKDAECAQKLQEQVAVFYSPISCMYHYLSMAKGNFRDYLKKERVRTKKYFYVLRPVLACKWIEEERGPVPTEFGALLDGLLPSGEVREEIEQLLELKRSGDELDDGPRIPAISDFLQREIERLDLKEIPRVQTKDKTEILDELFRFTLDAVW